MARRIANLLAWAVSAGLFVFVLIRALAIPCTFDEGVTYVHFLRSPVAVILSPRPGPLFHLPSANNHLLNTLLAKAAAGVAGSSMAALRIPNVLAFPSYALFSWLVLRRLAPPAVALAGFAALLGNLFVLDFFSLCRGYGLALGLLAPGVWFALAALDAGPGRSGKAAGAVICLSLAMLASFPLLAPLAVVAAGIPAFRIARKRRGAETSWDGLGEEIVPGAITLAAALAIGIPYLAVLSGAGELYYGGSRGLFADTVRSLVKESLAGSPSVHRIAPWLAAAVAAGWAAATLLALFVAVRRRGDPRAVPLAACAALLGGTLLLTLLAHGILGSNYPISRTAISLVPLFSFLLFGAIGWIARSPIRLLRVAASVFAAAIAAASVLHFAAQANLRPPRSWDFDMDTPAMLDDLARVPARREPIRLGYDWMFSSAIDYYRLTVPMPWLSSAPRGRWSSDADFVFVQPHRRAAAERAGFRVMRTYPETGNVLLVRR